ncbi:MAG: hypothetical protein Ta2F_15030 [Termitinemataceae bacterium]|nr:MAG: hypothetical protein Ta2F_15030 [Termitinemataceae bacterium]
MGRQYACQYAEFLWSNFFLDKKTFILYSMPVLSFALNLFAKIKIYALVGASGTGKSYQAKFVAKKYKIDFLIDDGLLIRNNKIAAGCSAKEEKTFMAAVKAALFDEKIRRDEIARKLHEEKFKRLLIIGTSDKMVNKIAARLQLPPPCKIIKIEDFASQKDIENAIRMRRVEGKHIIPVPSVEIKKSYPHIFHSAVAIFKPSRTFVPIAPVPVVQEKSLVRPAYSKLEKLIISKKTLNLMVLNCINEYDSRIVLKKFVTKDCETGYKFALTLDIPFGTQLEKNILELRQYITENIEKYTGILIEEVNIIIDKIIEMA